MKKIDIIVGLFATIVFCSPAVANSPASLKQALIDALMAEQIAIDCPTIRQQKSADRALDKALRKAARDRGMSTAKFHNEVIPFSREELVAYGNNFIRAQGIDENDPNSWCEAGNRLIETGDPVGKFLRKR